jgi:hypothetical protein
MTRDIVVVEEISWPFSLGGYQLFFLNFPLNITGVPGAKGKFKR